MNTIAIDTHKTVKKLLSSGFSQEQAEGFVEALTESDLVTHPVLKSELAQLEARLEKKIFLALLLHGFTMTGAIVAAAALI